jgi:hypothetical protein
MEDSESNEGFTIRDKRHFSVESEDTDKKPESPESAGEGQSVKPEHADDSGTQHKASGPVDLSTFILGLANTALFQLGLIKGSESDGPQKDLTGAQQTIDFIGLLEEKTRGNLTEKEAKIIKETLFQLRLAYVEMSNK